MTEITKQALQNGLVFIEDVKGGKLPFPFTDEKIQHTPSCVAVVCLHEIDGETELSLGKAAGPVANLELAFDGMIETPNRELVVFAVSGEPLLRAKVPDRITRIRVWRNHPVWADRVVVNWG